MMDNETKQMMAEIIDSIEHDDLIDIFFQTKKETRDVLAELLAAPITLEGLTREALSLSIEGMQNLSSKLNDKIEAKQKLNGTLKLTKKQMEPELKTVGAVDMQTYKAALEMVHAYKRGDQSAKRLNINKHFRQIEFHNKFRLISTNDGSTWQVMNASQYAKQLKIWNRAA